MNDLQKLSAQAQAQTRKMTVKEAGSTIVEQFFQANRDAILRALPTHIKPDAMLSLAYTALRTTPKLRECTLESLFGAIIQLSSMGLTPNSFLGHAYMIPFRNNRMGRMDINIIFGYRGLLELARRSGMIKSLAARAVYEKDEFSYSYGMHEDLSHTPSLDEDRGLIVAFYGIAHFIDGGHHFEVMSAADVNHIRDASQNYRSSKKYGKDNPWDTHYEEMGKKTVIRRMFKYLPSSIEMAKAVTIDEVGDRANQQMDSVLDHGEYLLEDESEAPPITDDNGEVFDPELHATKPDGTPVFNSDGSFRARRGAKKKIEEQQAAGEKDDSPPADNVDSAWNNKKPATISKKPATYAEMMDIINHASTREEINRVVSLADDLPDDQADEIFNHANVRLAELAEPQ